MQLDMSKYTFYTTKNTIIAVSTYAGKPVRGIAKCDPRDEFDVEKGKKLAAARCAEKIARKRFRNASIKYSKAVEDAELAEHRVHKMVGYKLDAANAIINISSYVEDLEKEMWGEE